MIQNNELYLQETINYRVLDDARKDLKWSISKTAEESKIPEGTVKNILNGATRNPGSSTLQQLCDALNVPIEQVTKPNKKVEIENRGIKMDDASILALKEIYELQISSMKETNEVHINNIRTHYEQHHQDLVDNFEKRLADKREINENLKEQIKDLKNGNFIRNVIIGIFVCGVIALCILELLHPEHGWLRF